MHSLFLGHRSLPSSGELILPLPVLRAKAEIKSASVEANKTNSSKNQPSVSGERKRKNSNVSVFDDKKLSLQSPSNGEKKTRTDSTTSTQRAKSSKLFTTNELCVVNKQKSHFSKAEVVEVEDTRPVTVKEKSPEPIEISDSELTFDDYEVKRPKKKVTMVIVSDSE